MVPILLISLMLGSLSIYLGFVSYRKYVDITRTENSISIGKIVMLSLLFGVSSGLFFFALVSISGTVAENKTNWSIEELLGLVGISAVIAVIVLLGSVYQITTTIKYRDHLNKKYKDNK
jgi:hypothetical protein